MLDVNIIVKDEIPRVGLVGRFDGLGAQLFEQEIERSINRERYWIIDFAGVAYLSSAGLRSLIRYGKKLNRVEGRLILTGLGREVKSVLETTGLLQLFGQTEGIDEALALLKNTASSSQTAQTFNALGRECTWQLLSGQECCLDIWNPLHAGSLKNLESNDLITASLEDISISFGIGGLGSDRLDAFEGLGSFIALERIVGVLPADAYNQPDFLVVKDPRELILYIASAAGFSGQPWGRLDLTPGSPFCLREIQELLFSRLQETHNLEVQSVGMVLIGQAQPGNGCYYHSRTDLLNGQPLNRDLPGQQTVLLIGLAAKPGWQADEQLTRLAAQHGKRPGEEFFIGNTLVFSDLLDWKKIKEPEQAMHYCSNLDLMQDVLMAHSEMSLSEGRVWFFIPGRIRSGEEKQLQLEVEGSISFPEEWEIITRRLYADARRVVLEPLHGGFSPGKPFRVTSFDRDGRRMLPTVVKLGPTSLIEKEVKNHQKYVHGYILNNSTTIMGQTTCGSSTGMRYNFVGISGPDSSLGWLTNRFREQPVEQLIPLFDKIFTHILKPWYGQPRWEIIKPYQEHSPLELFPMIFEAVEKEFGIPAEQETIKCPELGLTLPNPYRFLKVEYPARQSYARLWYTGINHGDLNMQNILLDERDNVFIIDFSETRPRNIISDFARLEPIFKFEMTRLGSDEDLLHFLEFEKALAQLDSLEQVPPFVYRGNDPEVYKVYQMICRIRKYAKTVVVFETDLIPYLIAMLEWVLPIVIFVNVTPWAKKAAFYSAALIVDQIMRLESRD